MSDKQISDSMSLFRANAQRSIRRMGFVNPQLANDVIKMQKDGFTSYDDQNKKKEAAYDYGDDDKSVLYVNGKLQSTIYGSMSSRESVKVNKVIEKYNQITSKTQSQTGGVNV